MLLKIFYSIYFFFFNKFVRKFYPRVKELKSQKEELFFKQSKLDIHKGKLVVFVNDEKTGKKLYNVIMPLYNKAEKIFSKSFAFTIDRCICDDNTVKCFRINFSYMFIFFWITKGRILKEQIEIVKIMLEKGFVLDKDKFTDPSCNSISEFFACFVPSQEQKSIKGVMEYIHYICSSGSDFEEFYKEHTENGKLYATSEIPYSLKLANVCYRYFKGGDIPENIDYILEIIDHIVFEKDIISYLNIKEKDNDFLIAFDESFKETLTKTEETEEYSVYDGNIKIFHYMTKEFKNLLKNKTFSLLKNKYLIEKIDKVIINLDEEPIGYTFKKQDNSELYLLKDYSFDSQSIIFEFFKKLMVYIIDYRELKKFPYCDVEFDIEKDLFFKEPTVYSINFETMFYFNTIKDLYNLGCIEPGILKKNFTETFFKIFLKFINQKYGNLSDAKSILALDEVRIINPVVAKEFINFALNKKVNYNSAIEEFFEFLKDYERCNKGESNILCYDQRFGYELADYPFLFDFEAEKEYSIKIKKGSTSVLQDGKRIVIYGRGKSSITDQVDQIRKEINSKFNRVTNHFDGWTLDHHYTTLLEHPQLIYSRRINSSGFYTCIGYVLRNEGIKCLKDILMTLNNKELCHVYGKLLRYFENYNIPFEYIYVDQKFWSFDIDIWDENFHIQKSNNFLENLFQDMINQGYNPNAIAFVKMIEEQIPNSVHWNRFANSLDSYCDEHDIYYSSNEKLCPICSKTKMILSKPYEENYQEVFEDEYAKHYACKINQESYILKVYKKSCLNLTEIEKNVDKIVNMGFASSGLEYFHQDCFIPYKKAFDSQKHFIGYLYNNVKFKKNEETTDDVCIDISDIDSLKNLPRIKSLIRLILQVKELTSQNLGFMENPFSHVFLNADHKRQVQILNIDFLQKGNVESTLKWTYEYISHILECDSSIEVDVSNCKSSLDMLLSNLQNLASDMTKYCSLHKMYYSKNFIFCPRCISKEILSMVKFEEKDKDWFKSQDCVMEGGESFIYHFEKKQMAKVFKEDEINYDLKIQIMLRILQKNNILQKCNEENHKFKFVYNKKFLLDSKTKEVFGYIMDEVENAYPISYLRDKENVKNLGFTLKDIFEILIVVAEGIKNLHERTGIFIGDLNGGNILFDCDKNVYFIDFDGMGIDELSPEFCTDGYIDPISKKNSNITMKDDWYSFAVQAFYYLTYTHPFNGIYSIVEDGKEVMLDIPDKMEKRISLLGSHGLKPPEIADDWEWMHKGLYKAFFDIFEKESRESIEPQLKRQYEILFSSDEILENVINVIRINDKFIAKEIKRFKKNVVHVFDENTALIKKKNGECYFQIFCNDEKCSLPEEFFALSNLKIRDVLISENEQYAFFVCIDKVIAVNLYDNSERYIKNIQNADNIVIDKNCVYSICNKQNEAILECLKFIPGSGVSKNEPIHLEKKYVKCFNVKFGNKFVLVVKSSDDNVDDIYCNNEKLCSIKCTSLKTKYGIYYDSISKLWLVVNGEGKGIYITPDGKYKDIDLSEYVNNTNVSNIYFEKELIYIPSDECLYIIKANDQSNIKKLECPNIMDYDSRLFDNNAKGFSVITNNTIYEVRRG